MIVNKWVKLKDGRFPLVETPITNQELIELQDDNRKFYLLDHKQNKISVIHSNRVTHSYKIELGERGMYYLSVGALGLLFMAMAKRYINKKMKKYNPFSTPDNFEELLNNLQKSENVKNGSDDVPN